MGFHRLNDEAKQRLVEAVRAAEARSRGEIVPMVVRRSSTYPEARLRCGLVVAGAATVKVMILASVWHMTALWAWLPTFQLIGLVVGAVLATLPPVERFFAGRRRMRERAIERAHRAFLEEGLTHTTEGTGVLVFASLFEHTAVVLGDHAIHAKLGHDWTPATQALVAGIRRGDLGGGLQDAIAWCGDRLAEHFPLGAGDVNELADVVRVRLE